MSIKVYNQLILKGKADEIRVALNKCYGLSPLSECKSTEDKLLPTFNSYVKLSGDNREEAYNVWGTSVDELYLYEQSFVSAFKDLDKVKQDEACKINLSFETINGIAFPWIKALAKANPTIEIEYFVADNLSDYFASASFDVLTKNEEYNCIKYKTNSELKHKFLNMSLEEVFCSELSYAQGQIEGYSSDENYVFKFKDIEDWMKREFSFLNESQYKELVKNCVKNV